MGSYSHTCKLSNLPITYGVPVVLIVMKPMGKLFDNSEESLSKYGSTYMCSNEGPRLKYSPVWFPIKGEYNDYGGIQEIVKDDNTAILEAYYDLTIEQIMEIVTSGRKDDGYDDSLKVIKAPVVYPDDWIKGEDHMDRYGRLTGDIRPFKGHYPTEKDGVCYGYPKGRKKKITKEEYAEQYKILHAHYLRYQEWTKTNPDYDRDYGNPQYLERYKELLTYSGMWVRGELYDKLTTISDNDAYNRIDLGTPEVLKALGFEEFPTDTTIDRYNIPFKKDGLTVYSDGTWLSCSVYTFKDFKAFCAKNNVSIDVSEFIKRDRVEQYYDFVLPKKAKRSIMSPKELQKQALAKVAQYQAMADSVDETEKESWELSIKEAISLIVHQNDVYSNDRDGLRYFLEMPSNAYSHNPLCNIYYNAGIDRKLRDNVVAFWRFDSFMYACGKFYEIVGTSPQCGDHKSVLKVLTAALEVLNTELAERKAKWGDDDDDDDDDEEEENDFDEE